MVFPGTGIYQSDCGHPKPMQDATTTMDQRMQAQGNTGPNTMTTHDHRPPENMYDGSLDVRCDFCSRAMDDILLGTSFHATVAISISTRTSSPSFAKVRIPRWCCIVQCPERGPAARPGPYSHGRSGLHATRCVAPASAQHHRLKFLTEFGAVQGDAIETNNGAGTGAESNATPGKFYMPYSYYQNMMTSVPAESRNIYRFLFG
jgi:hypothetical protein